MNGMTTRRTFLKNTMALGAGYYFLPGLISCTQMQRTKNYVFAGNENYTIKMLTDNVGYFTERGGTIGFSIQPEGITIVDTQFPEQAGHLIEALRETAEAPIELVVNTHHHGDHTSGNPAFEGITNQIVAHNNSKINQSNTPKAEQLYLPTITYEDRWAKNIGQEEIALSYHGPAHTNGDSYVHFANNNVVHTGDLVFNRRFPYIDKSAGASIENWIAVLDKAEQLFEPDTQFIFGHSGNNYPVEGNQEDIKAMKNYLEQLLEFGIQAKKEGRSLEELKKSTTVIPGAPQWKGKGIERSLDAVWMELTE